MENSELTKSWRELLGNPPKVETLFKGNKEDKKKWLKFHKKKWIIQLKQRKNQEKIMIDPKKHKIQNNTGID